VKPPLLAPQRFTHEITERLDYQGAVVEPIDEDDVRRAADRLLEDGVEAVAVCFLFSFLDGEHEERAGRILADAAPHWRVSLSSRILPTIREYPRLSTTVIDAHVGPIMESYLLRISERLGAMGVATPQLFLMQSNGGLMRINLGARFPNQTLLSGPAAGVVSGVELANLTGYENVVTFDMGGTSSDISVVAGGRIEETTQGRIAGQDIGTPMLSVRTLGAGGGTITHIGADGLLKVGPTSAGADPGPACYGRGGMEPTVTDANLVLGALGETNTLAGSLKLDRAAAEAAIRSRVAEPLGIDVVEAAAGILRIVNTNMAVDLRLAFQTRGEDPRRFALAAFGGAGPLHAAALARDLEIPHVLVPPAPGLTSAMGLLQTSVRHVYLRSSVGLVSKFPRERMQDYFAELTQRAMVDVAEEGFAPDAVSLRRQCDMRYLHQGYQLAVDCPDGDIDEGVRTTLKQAFDRAHQRVYGASAPDEDAEIVTFRIIAEIEVPQLQPSRIEPGDGDPGVALVGERALWDFETGGFITAGVFDRERLRGGDRIAGPAIIEQFDSTTVIPAGQSGEIDAFANLVVSTGAAP
jgi:N-methylhydantoinase A